MMWTPRRRHLCLVVLAWVGVNFSVCAADLSAEDRLKAIRTAMVEAAMKSNTRVSATSWMDAEGQLRELNRFSSEIKLRDLQVAKYGRDAAHEPLAELVAARVDAVNPERCDAPQAKAALRHVMTVGLAVSPSLPAAQRYQAQQLGFVARTHLLQSAARSERWRLINTLPQSRAYDRLSYGQGEENVQWHAQLSVEPMQVAAMPEGTLAYGLTLQVSGPGQRQGWFNAQEVIVPTPPAQAYGTPKFDNLTLNEIDRAVAFLTEQLENQLACEPQSFAVEQSGGRLSLNAGGNAGLRVGDRLVLADASVLPRHTLEPGALDAAVLAEVKSVTPYRAEIKQVAGRQQKFKGAWVAWPYTY